MPRLLIHVLTYNSAESISACLSSMPQASGIEVVVTDNASSDGTAEIVERNFGDKFRLIKNPCNLGYAAGHNQGFYLAKKEGFDFILLLNPDATLPETFVEDFTKAINEHPDYDFYTPKILRTDEALKPITPAVIDAAGMVLNSFCRHLDRGSNELDNAQYNNTEEVFGGTGAALLVNLNRIERLAIKGSARDQDKCLLYPQLSYQEEQRLPIFDEAFFAYREDAELAWRARNKGFKFLYVPEVIVYHRRVVTPERRSIVEAHINSASVRNRFLMQVVNFRLFEDFKRLLPGIIFWNLVVVLGVVFKEKKSLKGLREAGLLLERALERRALSRI